MLVFKVDEVCGISSIIVMNSQGIRHASAAAGVEPRSQPVQTHQVPDTIRDRRRHKRGLTGVGSHIV
jgi:hypothetical protein